MMWVSLERELIALNQVLTHILELEAEIVNSSDLSDESIEALSIDIGFVKDRTRERYYKLQNMYRTLSKMKKAATWNNLHLLDTN